MSTQERPQLEFVLSGVPLILAFAEARKRWPQVELGYIGTDRTFSRHYFQEWGNPTPFII
jgi:hypothetical protein